MAAALLPELLHAGNAPVAIFPGRADAIAALGVRVAREMEWATIPLVVMAPAEHHKITDGTMLKIG